MGQATSDGYDYYVGLVLLKVLHLFGIHCFFYGLIVIRVICANKKKVILPSKISSHLEDTLYSVYKTKFKQLISLTNIN